MVQHRYLILLIALISVAFIGTFVNFQNELQKMRQESAVLKSTISQLNSSPLVSSNELPSPSSQVREVASPSIHPAPVVPLLVKGIDEYEDKKSQDEVFDQALLIYNRIPKTASTSMMGITYDLCKNNGFNVIHINTTKNSHIMSLDDQRRLVMNVTQWKSRLPALYHGHIGYVDFNKFSVNTHPIYINMVRDPIDRLVSYYYFLRYGDDFRPQVARKRKGNKVTFDECVLRKEKDCDPVNMWIQIPFFCGQSAECWVPGSEFAFEQAKYNLLNKYLLVGVTEQMRDFVALLELTLPRFFEGATNAYDKGVKSHLRRTYNKLPPLQSTIDKLKSSQIWKMEQAFYNFALAQFNFQFKNAFNRISSPDSQIDLTNQVTLESKGRQFFFEKIRPKK